MMLNNKIKEFDTTNDLMNWLKRQDLIKYDVGLGLNGKRDKGGWECFPYRVSGYLFEKDNPVNMGSPFIVIRELYNKDSRIIKHLRFETNGY